jgi:hypothetical protein
MVKLMRWILPVVAVSLGGCEMMDPNFERVRGSGRLTSEERQVFGFDRVHFANFGDLRIEQGDRESLKIEAEDNILPRIRTEIEDGRLVIHTERGVSISPTVPVRYTLVVRNISELELSGSGTITASPLRSPDLRVGLPGSGEIHLEQLDAERLHSEISGSGEIELRGTVTTQEVDISGSGDYEAGDLQSDSTRVRISGSGGARVWARESLSANISGSGDVRYYGSPRVTKSVSGSGDVDGLGPR